MPESRTHQPQSAFDGVIAPKDESASGAESTFERAQGAAAKGSNFLSADEWQPGGAKPRSLDAVDAAIAHDADQVIESVFASVEDLLGDALLEEEVPSTPDLRERDAAATEDAAKEEDAALAQPEPHDEEVAAGDEVAEELTAPVDSDGAMFEPIAPEDALAAGEAQSVWDSEPDEFKLDQRGGGAGLLVAFLGALLRLLHPRRLGRLAVATLGVLAWPLNLAPEWARPYVDWVALSFVFWIPIIWVIALFVVGR